MKRFLLLIVLYCSLNIFAQNSRKVISIPDIPGYKTLKCDFHMHTVFSDGLVWPTYRVDEAWEEGLDAIAITDHLEFQPNMKDDLNKSYEIALPKAKQLDILLVHAAEITKSMPPGHFNALFITDANTIVNKDPRESVANAAKQNAFITWNHPGWKAQQPDTTKWFPIHTDFYNQNQLHGIEVVGYKKEYYPEAQKWAMEKNLTMIGSTDIHPPISAEFDLTTTHRTMTLVFAKERTLELLREAMFAHRTVVYAGDKLYGKTEFLEPIFLNSIKIENDGFELKKDNYQTILINNLSDIPFEIENSGNNTDIKAAKKTILLPHQITRLDIKGISDRLAGMKEAEVKLVVKNLLVAPDKGLDVAIKLKNRL